jgi:glycosyltransferase involved in cell wall biosynthesis
MPPLETGVAAWLISRLFHNRLLIDIRDDWESALGVQLKRYFPGALISLLSRISGKIYAGTSVILAATQGIAETIRKRGITTKMFLASNGADTGVFKVQSNDSRTKAKLDYGLPTDKVLIAYCGSGINPYYRLDKVLLTIRMLSKDVLQRLFFVFYVYNGRDRLDKLKSKLGIPDGVLEIRGPLPRKKLAQVLSACDVGLVPFDSKRYLLCARSTKMYEYLSSGLYVVSSGPKGGELESFFSRNPDLGSFIVPSVSNLSVAFRRLAKKAGDLYGSTARESRHAFIREHYDRGHTMRKAARAIRAYT